MAIDKRRIANFAHDKAEQEAVKEMYRVKLERRTQEIRESGDRWLAKLAEMPKDSAKRFK